MNLQNNRLISNFPAVPLLIDNIGFSALESFDRNRFLNAEKLNGFCIFYIPIRKSFVGTLNRNKRE